MVRYRCVSDVDVDYVGGVWGVRGLGVVALALDGDCWVLCGAWRFVMLSCLSYFYLCE